MPTLCLAIISSQEEQVPMLMKYSLIGVCGSWNPFQVTFNLDISVWKSMSVLISPEGKTSKTCPFKGADRSTMYAHDVASVIKRARLNAYQIWMIHATFLKFLNVTRTNCLSTPHVHGALNLCFGVFEIYQIKHYFYWFYLMGFVDDMHIDKFLSYSN